jgi:hypothetical protein
MIVLEELVMTLRGQAEYSRSQKTPRYRCIPVRTLLRRRLAAAVLEKALFIVLLTTARRTL